MSVQSYSVKADVYTDGARVEVNFAQTFTFSREMTQPEQEAVLARIAASDLKQVVRDHIQATLTGGGSRAL